MKEKKKSLFTKIFKGLDIARDGKGVDEYEDKTPNLKFFFKLLWRRKDKIFTVNILMLLMAIPIIACFFIYILAKTYPTQTSVSFAPLFGADVISSSPVSDLFLTLNSSMSSTLIHGSPVYIIIPIILVILFVVWGWLNVGTIYVLRGVVRHDGVFAWSDFFYGIKRNLKQGLFMGMIDFAIIGILLFDFFALYGQTATYFEYFMFFGAFALGVLYLIMRPYLYLMLITFELNIRKLFKNALIFSALGIKRNFMMLLGNVLVIGLTAFLMLLLLPSGLGIMIILPFFYLFGLCAFISVYSAYPIIQRYMIDPYSDESEDAQADEASDEE